MILLGLSDRQTGEMMGRGIAALLTVCLIVVFIVRAKISARRRREAASAHDAESVAEQHEAILAKPGPPRFNG